jgi:two-component system, cell cycle response regulator
VEGEVVRKLSDGLYWVGQADRGGRLQCNPYLLLWGGSAVLFDPGSVLDGEEVLQNVSTLHPIGKIDAVVLSHQDPDLCSALPLLERSGFSGVICCHERTAAIVRYYGVGSEFYYINRFKYRYRLEDGSVIKFIPAPYLHFPGAIMTYLPDQRALLSGDLFGAFGAGSLFARDDYAEAMKTFHESYMPSHDILGAVMSELSSYDITLICPQHGSIITENVDNYIEILRDLPCGRFLEPLRKNLEEAGGYRALCSEVVKRYAAIFGIKAVGEVYRKSPIVLDYRKREVLSSPYSGEELWNEFFSLAALKKGMKWLTLVSPLVEQMSRTYGIALPSYFDSLVFDVSRQQDTLNAKVQKLENSKLELESKLHELEESLVRCPVTKLYNRSFFTTYLSNELQKYPSEPFPFALMLLSIDNLEDINVNYGSEEGNASLQNLSYILRQAGEENFRAFKLEGGHFALYMKQVSKEEAVEKANTIKNTVYESPIFIARVSVSVGLMHAQDLPPSGYAAKTAGAALLQEALQIARFRLKSAKKRGKNSLVFESEYDTRANASVLVLLIDLPGLQRDLIERELTQRGFRVVIAEDGLDGREAVFREEPDLIISELMVPKKGALTLRRELLDTARYRDIPFLLISHSKDENSVSRAQRLGIYHYFKRPVILAELTGIVEMISQARIREQTSL